MTIEKSKMLKEGQDEKLKVDPLILDILKANPTVGYSTPELMNCLNLSRPTILASTKRLAKQGKVIVKFFGRTQYTMLKEGS